MIRVEEVIDTDDKLKTYKISAFADTKSEVQSAGLSDYVGLPSDATGLELGSDVITADGDFAFMKSNGQWNWI